MSSLVKSHIFPSPWNVSIKAYYREGTNDGGALISCIEQDEYKLAEHKFPVGTTAIDLGAHIGAATLAMLSREMIVYSVEVIPENYGLMTANIIANNYQSRAITYCASISNRTGDEETAYYTSSVTKHGNCHRFIGATIPHSKTSNLYEEGEAIQVRTISLSRIFTENRIKRCHFLKTDCEGAEWKAFKDLSIDILERIDIISGELHTLDRNKQVSHGDLLPLLKGCFIDITEEFEKEYCTPGEVTHFVYKNRRLV